MHEIEINLLFFVINYIESSGSSTKKQNKNKDPTQKTTNEIIKQV